MLTKEHLKFRVRAGRAVPLFLAADDAAALAQAKELITLFESASGKMTVGELEDAASDISNAPTAPAFVKLLLDACEEGLDDESVVAFRWDAFLRAEKLREQSAPDAAITAFQTQLADELGVAFETARNRLYGDLPACRMVAGFKTTTPQALLHRYNLALVQGLLLRARELKVRIKGAKITEKRELFRQLKFHRLLADVRTEQKDSGTLELSLGGPLSLFEQASAYGMRLARFFPHVLHLAQWEAEAEVHLKKRDLTLKLDQKSGLVSHYAKQDRYLPEELMAFLETFNTRQQVWQAAPGEDFVHIGKESYCFPDLTITGQSGQKVHVELFHKWHAGQLPGRLAALSTQTTNGLRIGVAKGLFARGEIQSLLTESSWFAKNGFVFSEFPTPKTLLGSLGGV